jgi:integrase
MFAPPLFDVQDFPSSAYYSPSELRTAVTMYPPSLPAFIAPPKSPSVASSFNTADYSPSSQDSVSFPLSIPNSKTPPPRTPSKVSLTGPLTQPSTALSTAAPSTTAVKACRYCSYTTAKASNLSRHIVDVHNEQAKKDYPNCQFCGYFHPSSDLFKKHTSTCRGETTSSTLSVASVSSSSPVPSSVSAPLAGTSSPASLPASAPGTVEGFLSWLSQTRASPDGTVMRRCSPKALEDAQRNITFLVAMAQSQFPSHTASSTLGFLIRAEVVEAVVGALKAKGRGAERQYQLAILLRKLLIYVCYEQSRLSSTPVIATQLPVFGVIYDLQREADQLRKLQQLDRVVLEDRTSDRMSMEEMTKVLDKCLARLDSLMDSYTYGSGHPYAFIYALITALLITSVAQRQQVLRDLTKDTLQPPRSPGNDDDVYIIKHSAVLSKSRTPGLIPLPAELTEPLSFYLTNILRPSHTGAIFVQKNGKPITDFSIATRSVCKEFIGRPINAHSLRHTMASAFHDRDDVTDSTMRSLAEVMNHTPEVQRSHYIFQERKKSVRKLQDMVMEGVRGGASGGKKRQRAESKEVVREA